MKPMPLTKPHFPGQIAFSFLLFLALLLLNSSHDGKGSQSAEFSLAPSTIFRPPADTTVVHRTFTAAKVGSGCDLTPISAGQAASGELTTGDCRSPVRGTDFFADRYSFTAAPGQQIAIALLSPYFDTYLYLIGPGGTVLAENDDSNGELYSRIPGEGGLFILPSAGIYTIEVTSFGENDTGEYLLGVTEVVCSYSVPSTCLTFGGAGSSATINVTSAPGCAWIANTDVNWISFASSTFDAGNNPVAFEVRGNLTGEGRQGTISIGGNFITLMQSVPTCTFSLSPTKANFGASGGTGTITVTTQAGCVWQPISSVSWITITSNQCEMGSSTMTYSVAPNNTGASRNGTITIGGMVFAIKQTTS